jgi:phage tail tape-measure protein
MRSSGLLLSATVVVAGLLGTVASPAGAATVHTFTISPSQGGPGTVITARGGGCHYAGSTDATVQVRLFKSASLSGAALASSGSVHARTDGTWTAQLSRLKATKKGVYYVTARCSSAHAGKHFTYQTRQFRLT